MNTDVVMRRIGAVIVDGLILFVVSAVVLGLLSVLGLDVWDFDSYSNDNGWGFEATDTWMSSILTGLIGFGYKAYQEAKYGGQTIGKRALGIRVVQEGSGLPINSDAAMTRAAMWQIPFVLSSIGGFFGLAGSLWLIAGLISVAASPLRQRLGDRVAHTVVIRDQPVVQTGPQGHLSVAAPSSSPSAPASLATMVQCAYCRDRFTLNLAEIKVVDGQSVRLCPNCGAPVGSAP
ncbi:MAG: RDD family protein [Thermomicrobiales bacterium]|nr:RDD family protein [Thermomicrobiales bacterium]